MEDVKLLQATQNNKLILVEELERTNDELKRELVVMHEKYHEQQELANEMQLTKETLVKQQERQQWDFNRLAMEKKKCEKECHEIQSKLDSTISDLEEQLEQKREEIAQVKEQPKNTRIIKDNGIDCNFEAPSNNTNTNKLAPSSITIPSDYMNKVDKKHVIEWDWVGPNFGGAFTGWVDLQGDPDGTGTLRIEDGSIYDGDWKHGFRHGTYTLSCLTLDVVQ